MKDFLFEMDVFESNQIYLRKSQASLPADKPTIPSWALDLALLAFGGATLWLVTQNLRFDDPRPERNAWTYCIAIPAIVIAIDLVMRSFVSRFIERAIQSAFLFSVMLHLLLTFGAVNLVLFSRSAPDLSAALNVSPEAQNLVRPSERPPAPEYFESKDFEMDAEIDSSQRPEYMKPASTDDSEAQSSEATKQELVHQSDSEMVEAPQAEASIPDKAEISKVEAEWEQPEITSEAEQLAKSEISANPVDSAPIPSVPIDIPQGSTQDEQSSQEVQSTNNSMERSAADVLRSNSTTAQSASMLPDSALDMPLTENANATFAKPDRRAIDAPRRASPYSAPSDRDVSELIERMNVDVALSNRLPPGPSSTSPRSFAPSKIEVPKLDKGNGAGDSNGETSVSQDAGDFAPSRQSSAADQRSSMAKAATRQSTSGPIGPAISPNLDPTAGASSGELRRRSTASLERKSSEFRDLEPEIGSTAISIPSRFPKPSAARITPSTSTVPIPAPAFQQRMARNEGASDAAELGDFGPETEAAIERGLQFLSRTQRKDGSWHLEDYGDNPRLQSHTAATGLSLLAFQGAGYSHRQYQYADVCKSALEFLIANQKPDGDLYIETNGISNANIRFYSHSIASLALCEAYGMTQDVALKAPAQAAVDFMVRSQDPVGGGWRYQPGYESDTSVSGWFMMALKSAELSGLSVPQSTFEKIESWLDKAQASPEQRHLYRYNPLAPDAPSTRRGRQVNPTMTGVGLLMRLYLGWRRDNINMARGADYLLQNPPSVGTAAAPLRDTYYWYYATQVMFHMGGERWRKWNAMLHPLLVKSQQVEGPESGSWNPGGPVPDRWGPFAGRLYVTTLNLLSLEVYYRHLPIYEDTAR